MSFETPAGPRIMPRIMVAVPLYNHAATVRAVVQGALAVTPYVMVVDDGSSDGGAQSLEGLDIRLIRHDHNQGKGAAIRSAALAARALEMTHLVTIDADGQHDPAEIAKFMAAVNDNPFAIHVGKRDFDTANVPGSSRFGRSFSNFWLRVQTGQKLGDAQSGFRAYPLAVLEHLHLNCDHYDMEVEVLVKAAWMGVELRDVDISVHYPPREERVSHFKAFKDNVRISLLNTKLTMRSFMPLPHRQMVAEGSDASRVTLIHPMRSLKILLGQDNTPRQLALAAALGVFLSTLPLIGLHTMAILFATGFLRLSKITALAAGQLCIPPFVPALCVEAGFFLRHGRFLTEISFQTLGYEALQRIWEYLIGSLVMAPILALVMGLTAYLAALAVKHGINAADKRRRT